MRQSRGKYRVVIASLVVAGLGWTASAFADDHIKGVITGRDPAGALVVQTDSAKLMVAIDDATKVRRIDGVRPVAVTSADLIPGLRIKADGEYETAEKFNAHKVQFTKADFRTAAAIQGGVMPTDQRSLANQAAIAQHAQELASHGKKIGEQGQVIDAQGRRITQGEQAIVATAGAVAAANARISNLDNYNVIKSVTVYFQNGKANLSKSDKAALQAIAADAKGVNSYLFQVQAYASAVGAEALNQKLSMDRANAVTAILQQSGIELDKVIVPAAMGTTDQVASNATAKGQAENRRAVVTLLQNKGINGN